MKAAIIIPARYKSSRFPGKPLAKILGKEMILRVAEICKKAQNKKNIYVATDNRAIKNLVEKNGLNVIMTSSKCKTGTDRVAEASKKINADIYVNVQGDEPLINFNDINKIKLAKKKFPNHVICGFTKMLKNEDPKNINLPKVVTNHAGELVYISRLPIPGTKDKKLNMKKKYFKQVCIYAFNKKELRHFAKYKKKAILEKLEDIEILRFFELGIPIKMIKINKPSIAVDIKSDIEKVERYIKKNE